MIRLELFQMRQSWANAISKVIERQQKAGFRKEAGWSYHYRNLQIGSIPTAPTFPVLRSISACPFLVVNMKITPELRAIFRISVCPARGRKELATSAFQIICLPW